MLFTKLYERYFALYFWENMSTLNEFIGYREYVGLTDFVPFGQHILEEVASKTVSGNFYTTLKYFPVATIYAKKAACF